MVYCPHSMELLLRILLLIGEPGNRSQWKHWNNSNVTSVSHRLDRVKILNNSVLLKNISLRLYETVEIIEGVNQGVRSIFAEIARNNVKTYAHLNRTEQLDNHFSRAILNKVIL